MLRDDSFNPTNTNGNLSFYSDEIISNQAWDISPTINTGLDLKVVAKLNTSVGGIVFAPFLYNVISPTVHNEVDLELVSNQVAAGANQIESNVYANAPFDSGVSMYSKLPLGGLLTSYHTYEEQVFSDHVTWLVDGVQIRTENTILPTGPLHIYLNIWTPDKTWPAAYNAGIQAVATAAQKQEFTASVDSVVLSRINDIAPPTPNTSTWDTPPSAISNSAISMTATTATDPAGVEYYFHNLTVTGHDSSWQASPTYVDTGLNANTSYTYQVKTRDKSANQNTGLYSVAKASTTLPLIVTNAAINMSVNLATLGKTVTGTGTITGDGSGPVSYYWAVEKPGTTSFLKVGVDLTANLVNGSATIANYTSLPTTIVGNYSAMLVIDSGLSKGMTSNTVSYSVIPLSPTPNPSTWAVKPIAVDNSSITMTATTATDPAGVEYFFHNLTIAGHDSGWQNSSTFVDTGLNSNTAYAYQVKTRDKSIFQNTGLYSVAVAATTLKGPPATATGVTIGLTSTSVVQNGSISGSGTLLGVNNGTISYYWAMEIPGATSFQKVGNGLTVSLVNGSATIANFTGIPTDMVGNYAAEVVIDSSPAKGLVSNVVNYTVTAPPPITVTKATISLVSGDVSQGGIATGSGSLVGTNNGTVSYYFAVQKPGTSSFVKVGNDLTTNMVNGSATIPSFTGLPTDVLGSYVAKVVIDSSSSSGLSSNTVNYTVSALKATITVTSMSGGYASGKVTGVNPANYVVVVYIYISVGDNYADGWWGPKPYWNQPYTTINANGTWTATINTGGVDGQARAMIAYLVPVGTAVPSLGQAASLPTSLSIFPSATN